MGRPKRRKKDSRSDDAEALFSESYQRIHAVLVRIPRGRVMTYGEVAAAAGLRGAARLVGYALRVFGKRVPWQRVLGKRRAGVAQVAIKDPIGGTEQRLRLENEGVRFSASGGVDLARYGHAKAKAKPKATTR